MINKILFVIGIVGNGGAERVIVALANKLIENNIEVGIVTIYSKRQDYELDSRINLKHITANNKIKIFRPIERVIKLRKYIKEYDPNCVISFLADVNLHSILACWNCNIPLIVSERNDPYQDPNQKWVRRLRDLLYNRVDGLVLQTNDAKNYFDNKISEKIEQIVIPNPLTPNLPFFKGDIENNRLITACRLNTQKNLKMMIDSIKIVNQRGIDCFLDIYGDGPLKNELINYIKSENLESKVQLRGFTNRIHEEMLLSKAFLISSNYEGISNSMLEALAIGIPVVATDCPIGGAKMFIKNKINGWLTQVGNVQEFSDAIVDVFEHYEKSIKIGKEATKIRNILNIDIICEKWLNFVQYVIKEEKN